ncbi:MAG TPA: hypothetical protein VJY62_09340 [Bacteroidia bacterium]|nr:hypothetical protein [Bacteroidia bacterium]
MFLAVIAYTMNPLRIAITSSVEAWLEMNENLQNRVASIKALAQTQAKELKGFAAQKKSLKNAACQLVYSIIKPALAYARATGNDVLIAMLNRSLTNLKETDDSVFAQVMNDLISAVNAEISHLGPYAVNPAMITAATDSVSAYGSFQATPRDMVAQRKATTHALNTLVKDTNDFVRLVMDPMSVAFKKEATMDYYNSYLAERKHVPVHSGTTKIRVTVIDEVSGNPVPLAVCRVDESEVTGTTGINGKVSLNKVPRGIQRIIVTCNNYQEYTSAYISMIQGSFFDITVRLNPAFNIPAPAPESAPQGTVNN